MTARWSDIPGLFLSNGSVNTFPPKGYACNRGTEFSMWSVPRCYKQGTRVDLVSPVLESVKRGLEPEAEE
jgi:hypothetical protein